MGKEINEYIRAQHGETPWNRQTNMSEAGKGQVTRWDHHGTRKYDQNYPEGGFTRPEDWKPNPLDDE